jgi:hypothetical protein
MCTPKRRALHLLFAPSAWGENFNSVTASAPGSDFAFHIFKVTKRDFLFWV